MAVSTTDTYSGPYSANGVTVAFPFTFKAVSSGDVAVIFRNGSGSESLANEDDFTVALSAEGGTVIFGNAPAAANGDVYVVSEPSFLQSVEFALGQPFLPTVLNEVNDRDVARALYLKRQVDRSPKTPLGGGVEGQFPVVLPGGGWGFASGTGNDPALRTDMADPAPDKGAALVIFDQLNSYPAGSVGAFLATDALNAAAVLLPGFSAGIMNANRDALEALLADADERNLAVRIPQNIGGWHISPGIISPLVPLIVEGSVFTNTTDPMIFMTASGAANSVARRFHVGGGGRVYNLNGTQNQRDSCFIQFDCTDVYILYPAFENLDTYGFYYSFINDCPTFGSPFGRENRMNHIQSSGIIPHYWGALNAKGAFLLKRGSGTGGQWVNCADDLAVGSAPNYNDPVGDETLGYPAYVRVESGGEANVVCGDFSIEGDFAGLEAGMLSVDAACIYKSKIKLSGQVDAQARRTVFEDPPGNYNFRACQVDVLTGGTINIVKDGPYFAGSEINGIGDMSQTCGFGLQDLTSGAKSFELLVVQPRIRSTCFVEITVTGESTGVNAGGLVQLYAVRHNGSVVTAVQKQAFIEPSSPPAGFFDVSTSIDAGTGACTFTLTFTPTTAGSAFEFGARVFGGIAKVRRGDTL